MELTKQEIVDRRIYQGIWKILLYETTAEFEIILTEHPELLTQRAISIFRHIVNEIPETEVDIRAEWGRRVEFLAGKIDAAV